MAKLPQDVAIRVHDVHKDFRLPHNNEDTLKRRVTSAFKKKDKTVDVHHALRGITFDIKKGEFFGILGRNGSGKSTLLKIISEIYQPTKGYTKTKGKVVAFIELGVGFKTELTGRENVYLNGAMLGFSHDEMEAMYDQIVAFAELEEFMDQKLKNYSSGMKVRLAFSVAIRAQADILILDEVLAVGDKAFQDKCYNYFRNLKEAHKTIVLVSHSMGLVKQYCDKAIVINDGKIIYNGEVEGATDEYLSQFAPTPSKKKAGHDEPTHEFDKRVTIESVTAICTSKKIKIDIELDAKEAVGNTKLAVRILNAQKNTVVGVNSESTEQHKNITFDKTGTKKVTFNIENILGNGNYSLDVVTGPAIVTGVYHDKMNDVASFSNARKEGHYPVVAPATIEVE